MFVNSSIYKKAQQVPVSHLEILHTHTFLPSFTCAKLPITNFNSKKVFKENDVLGYKFIVLKKTDQEILWMEIRVKE